MRRFLYDWHLSIGKFAGALILVWSASGALMSLDPLARKAFDAEPPKLKSAPVEPSAFTFPVGRLPLDGASSVALRSFGGRSWYEARWPDGRVAGFDARSGAPASAELTAEELGERVAKAVAPKWTVLGVDRLTANDDHYRPADFPAYRLSLAGPGAPVLYLSSRDGSLLKSTTRMSRAARWLGMGVHTWNPEALKKSFDWQRRWALALFVALPLFVLAALSYALLYKRDEDAARAKTSSAKKGAGAVVAAALVLASGEGAWAQVTRVAVQSGSLTPAPGFAPLSAPALMPSPGAALPASSLSVLSVAPSAPPPFSAVSAAVLAPVRAVSAAAAAPARALPVAAAAVPVSERAPAESQAVEARAVFDGSSAAPALDAAMPVDGVPSALAPRLLAASAPEAPRARETPKPARPADKKALWGIYVTHAAHLFTMSAAWRVAWPLLVIDLAGKAGLAAIGSAGALIEMGTGLVAGMLVDRFLPRNSMASAAVVRAAVAVVLYGVASAGVGSFPLLFGAFLAHSFALTTIHIGQSSAAPVAAGDAPGALRRVNSILKIVTAAVSIPGSLIGGWAVASMGVPGALIAYAVVNVAVLAPLYAWLMPKSLGVEAPPAATAAPEKAAGAPGVWAAVKLIFGSKVLVGALIAMAAGVVLVEPLRTTTLPILAKDLSAGSAAMLLGGFQAAFYAGQFAGNFGLLKWGERLSNRGWILLGATGLLAFGLFALAGTHIGFAFAAAALIGLLTQPLSVVAKTAFQEEIRRLRPELLGRAMGVNNIFYRLSVSAGTALVGWASVSAGALAFGATATLAVVYGGVAVLLVAAAFLLMRGSKK